MPDAFSGYPEAMNIKLLLVAASLTLASAASAQGAPVEEPIMHYADRDCVLEYVEADASCLDAVTDALLSPSFEREAMAAIARTADPRNAQTRVEMEMGGLIAAVRYLKAQDHGPLNDAGRDQWERHVRIVYSNYMIFHTVVRGAANGIPVRIGELERYGAGDARPVSALLRRERGARTR